MAFRAADVVRVDGIDEKWLLAADEHEGHVICCGWPESTAPAAKCTLVTAATDEQRLAMLTKVAAPGRADLRASWARRDLDKPILWAVSVQGPDTLFAMPSREVAEARAKKWNAMIAESYERNPPHPDEMRTLAVVVTWQRSAESHAESLAKHGDDPEDIC